MPPRPQVVPHLWIVVTDPNAAGLIAIVSVTTLRNNVDQTLILRPGDHPLITHDSVVHFGDARIVEVKVIEAFAVSGTVKIMQSCSSALIGEIQQGLFACELTKNKVLAFCAAALKK